MPTNRIITLTTDFGVSSPYVAEMKGAILCIAPSVRIVDATHCVAPQNVTQGAFCLRQFADVFPKGTIHIAVVDPGVGTDREILLAECREQLFIAPNNGLLTFQLDGATTVRQITKANYWREPVSSTFHGRDIMGPVAAHLSNGEAVEAVASEFNGKLEKLSYPQPTTTGSDESDSSHTVLGEVVFVDSFGNLITNVSAADLAGREIVEVEFENAFVPFQDTYGDRTAVQGKALISLVGSSGWLEIAIANGSAAELVPDSVGKRVHVRLLSEN